MSRRSKEYLWLCAILFAAVVLLLIDRFGLSTSLSTATEILKFLREQLVTLFFILVAGSGVVWILKLHFSEDGEYKKFDLKKLITNAEGNPDGKKIAYWLTFGAALYAFFYLLIHKADLFLAYAPTFIGLTFTHMVARTMTEKPVAHNTEVG